MRAERIGFAAQSGTSLCLWLLWSCCCCCFCDGARSMLVQSSPFLRVSALELKGHSPLLLSSNSSSSTGWAIVVRARAHSCRGDLGLLATRDRTGTIYINIICVLIFIDVKWSAWICHRRPGTGVSRPVSNNTAHQGFSCCIEINHRALSVH